MGQQSSSSTAGSPRFSWIWLLFLSAGSLAGAVSGYVTHTHRNYFVYELPKELEEKLAAVKTGNPPFELVAQIEKGQIRAGFQNATLALGVGGALLCGVLGGLALRLRKGWLGLIPGSLVGLILGGAAGVGGGLAGASVAQTIDVGDMDELFLSMLIHAAAWIPIGLAAGVTVSGLMRSGGFFVKAVLVSFLAAGIAAAAFPFLSMSIFPADRVDSAIPLGRGSTIFWMAWVSGVIGLTCGRLLGRFVRDCSTDSEASIDSGASAS